VREISFRSRERPSERVAERLRDGRLRAMDVLAC